MLEMTDQRYAAEMRCKVAINRPGVEAPELKPARLHVAAHDGQVDLSLAIGDGTAADAAGLGEIEISFAPEGLKLLQTALKKAGAALKK